MRQQSWLTFGHTPAWSTNNLGRESKPVHHDGSGRPNKDLDQSTAPLSSELSQYVRTAPCRAGGKTMRLNADDADAISNNTNDIDIGGAHDGRYSTSANRRSRLTHLAPDPAV